jgi:hypothetical protein
MARGARSAVRGTKPFDATTKYLFDLDPAAWLAYAGLPIGSSIRPLETDLSTVAAQADKVARVEAPTPWLAHFEFQSSADPELAARLLQYNVLLHRRHGGLVESVVVLLRPAADHPDLTGVYRQAGVGGGLHLEFHYTVVRVWERPVEAVLRGALAGLPLAPLARGSETDLPSVLRRIDERLRAEVPPAEADRLWTATYWLAGLRYTDESAVSLFQRMRAMRDSATYQAVLTEGRTEEAKRLLLLLGEQRFGPPDERTRRAIAAMADLDRIERIGARLLEASGWGDLLATP